MQHAQLNSLKTMGTLLLKILSACAQNEPR